MVRTWAAQLEGLTAYFTSTFSFDLYTNKPQALVCLPEVTFSIISKCSGTGKAAEGGWLPIDMSSVVEPHHTAHKESTARKQVSSEAVTHWRRAGEWIKQKYSIISPCM